VGWAACMSIEHWVRNFRGGCFAMDDAITPPSLALPTATNGRSEPLEIT